MKLIGKREANASLGSGPTSIQNLREMRIDIVNKARRRGEAIASRPVGKRNNLNPLNN